VHALVLVSAWLLNAYGWLSAVPWSWLLALFLGLILLGIIVAALKGRPARRVLGSPHDARCLRFLARHFHRAPAPMRPHSVRSTRRSADAARGLTELVV
jgi:hypothetical protein